MTVVLSAFYVANYPEGGGHFWEYMQFVQGLRQIGCDVYWLESLQGRHKAVPNAEKIALFAERMERYGMGGKFILYENRRTESGEVKRDYVGISASEAEAVFRRADLLLNFHYRIDPALLSMFRRTALVDFDPGLLQTWMSTGQMVVAPHDVYLTTGETVGTPGARIPDCGISWRHIRPLVSLEHWPVAPCRDSEAFSTVSAWWTYDWLKDEKGNLYDNNKRVSFLEFLELPRFTPQALELALYFGESAQDAADRKLLESHGWRIRHSLEVARTPEMYQAYIQQSRGEFSCAKPSCMKFQGAWVSVRTLCYLASGKPVVVQHTGPSSYLPNGLGMFRFSTLEEAVSAFEAIHSDYERHSRAAREIAEAYFDAGAIAESILNQALGERECALPCATAQGPEATTQIHER